MTACDDCPRYNGNTLRKHCCAETLEFVYLDEFAEIKESAMRRVDEMMRAEHIEAPRALRLPPGYDDQIPELPKPRNRHERRKMAKTGER